MRFRRLDVKQELLPDLARWRALDDLLLEYRQAGYVRLALHKLLPHWLLISNFSDTSAADELQL